MQAPADNILTDPALMWVVTSFLGILLIVIGYLVRLLVGDFKQALKEVGETLSKVTETQREFMVQMHYERDIRKEDKKLFNSYIDELHEKFDKLETRINDLEKGVQ